MLEQQQQHQACMLEQQQQGGVCWPLLLPAGNSAFSKGNSSRCAAGYAAWCAVSTGICLLGSACIACWAARARCYLEGSKIKHRWLRKPLQQLRFGSVNRSTTVAAASRVVLA
jgi:hypothetical protein